MRRGSCCAGTCGGGRNDNPIRCYREDFARQMDWLMAHPDRFHDYAFGVFRQLGANFQLLATHFVGWHNVALVICTYAHAAAETISTTTKAMQFKVARIANRGRFDPCGALFDTLEASYERVMDSLTSRLD